MFTALQRQLRPRVVVRLASIPWTLCGPAREMAGHAKWQNIAHTKGKMDAQRSKTFNRLSRIISTAVKTGGNDPAFNPTLASAIQRAREANMPKEKIQNAVRKGESGGATLHKFEVTTPGGAALIVEGEADKRDQVYSELQTIMNKRQCQVAKEGSVAWMFRHCGVVRVDLEKIPGELDLDEIAIECEAEDIQVDVGQLMNYGLEADSSDMEYINVEPTNTLTEEQHEFVQESIEKIYALETVVRVASSLPGPTKDEGDPRV